MSQRSNSPIPQFNPKKIILGSGENIPNYIHTRLNERDIEALPYVISFIFYRDDLCQIKILEQAQARKSLQILKNAGQCKNQKELLEHNVGSEKVPNSEDYKKYFTKLTLDVDLRHCNIGKEQRMFYFIEDVDKTFNVVALRNVHER